MAIYVGKDKSNRSADNEPYRNTKHYSIPETDYSMRDFTAKAAQNLEADESLGKSKTLKWEMINESKSLIYYIMIYENN